MSAPAPLPPPEGVLVQSVYTTADGVASGWRVWDDGRHESRRDGGDWEEVERLDDAAVEAVRSALAEAGLPAAAGAHRDPDARPGGALWLQAAVPEGPVAVGLLDGAGSPVLDALMERLVPILSAGAL